jgi:hypothetical protein
MPMQRMRGGIFGAAARMFIGSSITSVLPSNRT